MIVALTGHTRGIGHALAATLASQGDTITGYSRSTGYDIATSGGRLRICEAAGDADVFINNAFDFTHMFAQVDMLYAMYEHWKTEPKIIISIGSNSADGIKSFVHKYAVAKAALDKAVEQLQNLNGPCKIVNVRFGLVATARIASLTQFSASPKLSVERAAKIVSWILQQPSDILVKSITVEPRG